VPDVELIPLVIGGLMMLIPIIAILTRHQQKMTEMLNSGRKDSANQADYSAHILSEIAQMRQQMNDLTLAVEQLKEDKRDHRELESRISR
jgi:hypothetical protein